MTQRRQFQRVGGKLFLSVIKVRVGPVGGGRCTNNRSRNDAKKLGKNETAFPEDKVPRIKTALGAGPDSKARRTKEGGGISHVKGVGTALKKKGDCQKKEKKATKALRAVG